jgi:hypothetical protein
MIPSPSSSVPLFHLLGNGTVEQTLKALADKVLERKKRGTTVSRSVPRRPQNANSALRGTLLI